VILQHGLIDSSDTFVINEDPALAYLFADAGFDVWMPNLRGNKYSKMHRKLKVSSKEYWNFSVDEVIKYDLKVVFTRIMEVTKFEQLFYAGHSMSGGSFIAAAARDPEFYRKHTKDFVGLAPSTRSLNSVYLLRLALYSNLFTAFQILGVYEILNLSENVRDLFSSFCDSFPDVCSNILKLLADQHPEYDNQKKYRVFFNHYPSGTSTHQMIHIMQQSTHYGFYEYQRDPNDPLIEYDFSKFPTDIPVAIYAGASDLLVSVMDTRWLRNKLNTCSVVKEYKEFEGYGHLTFILPGKYYDPYYNTVAFFKHYK
jgi:pimeloyl-ACP methyl ester carboxylesterase